MQGDIDRDREDVLADCLEAAERGDLAHVELACHDHPDLAKGIRDAISAASALSAHARGTPKISALIGANRKIGRFEIERELGRGGSGIVFVARDPNLQRSVALKMLALGVSASDDAVSRFHREITALARVRHPNIASIYESGETVDRMPWFAMELVDGVSLDSIIRRHAGREASELNSTDLSLKSRTAIETSPESSRSESWVEAIVRLGVGVADALACAHETGVIHRDVKPGNILVDVRGAPRLVDFGLAFDRDEATVTRTGATPGTPQYMSPEQVVGDRAGIGPWTDVYALGVTLYHALTLRAPFDGTTTLELFHRIQRDEPPLVRKFNRRIPHDLEVVLAKSMEKQPARRYSSVALFRDDLIAVLESRPILARPQTRLVRAIRWVRRRPMRATFLAMTIAAISIGALSMGVSLNHERNGDLALAEYHRFAAVCEELKGQVERELVKLGAFLPAMRRGEIAAMEQQLALHRIQCETALGRAEDEYRAAFASRSWLPWLRGGVRRDRAKVLRQRAEDARARGEVVAAAEFDRQANAIVPRSGDSATGSVVFVVEPKPTEVFLFRYEPYESLSGRHDRVPRLVPVPVDSSGLAVASAIAGFEPGDPCLVILSVEPGSPAASQGLERGDHVLSINGNDAVSGVWVREVISGSKADRAGVRAFDRVLRLNGRVVTALYDWESFKPSTTGIDVECLVGDGLEREITLRVALSPLPDSNAAAFEIWASRFTRRERLAMRERGLRETHGLLPLEEELGIRVCEPSVLLRTPLPKAIELTCAHHGGRSIVQVGAGTCAGITAEPTAYPLIASTKNRVDPVTSSRIRVPPGSYIALLRAPGYLDLRRPFLVTKDEHTELSTSLVPINDAPPGDFVCIDAGEFVFQRDPQVSYPEWSDEGTTTERFFIARYETTMNEWWEFLDDPANQSTVLETAAKPPTSLVPCLPSGRVWGFEVTGSSVDSWPVPDQAGLDSPVIGLSSYAIAEYLRWKNKNARARGEPWEYRLSTQQEWEKAARGVDGRHFVWGDRFDFSLCNSLVAYPPHQGEVMWLEPVGRFPTDESPFGVRDLAGGAAELNDGVLAPDKAWDVWRGGSWDCGVPLYFRAASRVAARDDMPNRGFRLVARRVNTRAR